MTHMQKLAIFFDGKQEIDLLPFMFFVSSMNKLQRSFEFIFPDADIDTYATPISHREALSRQKNNEEIFRDTYDLYVFITKEGLEGNLFWESQERIGIITTAGWSSYFSP